jgi:hypothetical protein
MSTNNIFLILVLIFAGWPNAQVLFFWQVVAVFPFCRALPRSLLARRSDTFEPDIAVAKVQPCTNSMDACLAIKNNIFPPQSFAELLSGFPKAKRDSQGIPKKGDFAFLIAKGPVHFLEMCWGCLLSLLGNLDI